MGWEIFAADVEQLLRRSRMDGEKETQDGEQCLIREHDGKPEAGY